MNRFVSTLSIALLFVVTTAAQTNVPADGPVAPPHQFLTELEPFVGSWEGTYDPPGGVPPGKCRVELNWICYKSYLQVRVYFVPDGTEITLSPMMTLIGYNGELQTPYAWDFGSISQAGAVATISSQKVVMQNTGFNFKGRPQSRTVTYSLRMPDEMVVTNENILRAGEAVPDDDILVLKRVSGRTANNP